MAGLSTLLRRRVAFEPPPGSYQLAVGEQRYIGRPETIWLTPGLSAAHALVLGQTGAGKTKLIEALCRQYLEAGQGFCLLDLHGDLAVGLRDFIAALPPEIGEPLLARVVWLDLADPKRTVTFNPLEAEDASQAATQLLELIAAFRRHWADSWGPRLADLLTHTLSVLQAHGLTLAEVPLVLGDARVRTELLTDARVPQGPRDYFQLRYDPLPKRDQVLMSESTMNKVGALMSDYRVRTFLGAAKGTLSPRRALSEGHIVLARVPRGVLVENADVVASLLLAAFHTAALSRVALPPAARTPYALVLDEAQVASETFPALLAGARAFGLGAVCGVQFMDQLPLPLAEALLANCRVRVCFRVSRRDAERLARELFRADGDHVKYQERDLLGSRTSRPTFWSVQEEVEYQIRELQDQRTGECVIQLGRRPPWFAESLTVAPARPNGDDRARAASAVRRRTVSRTRIAADIEARRERLTNPHLTPQKGGPHDPDDAIQELA